MFEMEALPNGRARIHRNDQPDRVFYNAADATSFLCEQGIAYRDTDGVIHTCKFNDLGEELTSGDLIRVDNDDGKMLLLGHLIYANTVYQDTVILGVMDPVTKNSAVGFLHHARWEGRWVLTLPDALFEPLGR